MQLFYIYEEEYNKEHAKNAEVDTLESVYMLHTNVPVLTIEIYTTSVFKFIN